MARVTTAMPRRMARLLAMGSQSGTGTPSMTRRW
jgi:hypothetical protein